MANALTTFNAEYWAKEMQYTYIKENVARGFTSETLASQLTDGTRINRPYRSGLRATTYTKGTDISTYNDLTGVNEFLDIDTTPLVAFYVDFIDKIENKWDMESKYARDAMRVLNNGIDQAVFAEYSNAYSYVSAQDLGGSGTGSAAITTANIANLFTVASRNLDKYNRGPQQRFATVGPRLRETLRLALSGRETAFGEKVGMNGIIGSRYGFDIYFSNNIPFSTTVVTSGIPTAGDLFYVDGVKFTWTATGANCDTAGEVDIEAAEDDAYDNLVLAINGTTAGTTGTYYDVSADDRETLINGGITASYTSNALIISGYGDVVINEADTHNVTSVTTTSYPMFGVKGSIDLVVEKEPSLDFVRDPDRLGNNVFAWTRYGKKTFTKEKKGLVYAKTDASNWV